MFLPLDNATIVGSARSTRCCCVPTNQDLSITTPNICQPTLAKKGGCNSRTKTMPCSGYFSPRSNSTCDWQQGHIDLTVHHSGTGVCCRSLQSPGPPLRRHSHLALLILSIPLHDSRDPVHITRLSRDHSPRWLSITYNIITVISAPSSSAGRERIQLDGRRERRTGHSSGSPFSPHVQSLHVFIINTEGKTFWAMKRRGYFHGSSVLNKVWYGDRSILEQTLRRFDLLFPWFHRIDSPGLASGHHLCLSELPLQPSLWAPDYNNTSVNIMTVTLSFHLTWFLLFEQTQQHKSGLHHRSAWVVLDTEPQREKKT